jgi:two-component sensor histidine kinase
MSCRFQRTTLPFHGFPDGTVEISRSDCLTGMHPVVRPELAPCANSNNTEINGPDVVLRPEAGQAMAMVIDGLATNAAKYGAL